MFWFLNAGAVVTKDVPAYAVVAGSPARIVKELDPDTLRAAAERGRALDLATVVDELLDEMRQRQPRPVRLIGVSAGALTDELAPRQLSLFDLTENETPERHVDQVVDKLADTLGSQAIYRGTSHQWLNRRRKR